LTAGVGGRVDAGSSEEPSGVRAHRQGVVHDCSCDLAASLMAFLATRLRACLLRCHTNQPITTTPSSTHNTPSSRSTTTSTLSQRLPRNRPATIKALFHKNVPATVKTVKRLKLMPATPAGKEMRLRTPGM